MVAQRPVVEEDAGYDERPGEGAAPGFVCSGDEARTEASVEAQELLAGPLLHARDDSARSGGRQCV